MSIINSTYYPYTSIRNDYADKSVVTIDVSYVDRMVVATYCGYGAVKWELDEELAVSAVNHFIQNNLRTMPSWNLLHGAALAINGKTVLFLGRSEAGKTTLAAYLAFVMEQSYISEDMLIINYEKNELTPFPRNLNLRHGTLQLLKDAYSFELSRVSSQKLGNYDRLICKPTRVVEDARHIDCIVLLQRGSPTDCCAFELINKNKIDILLNSCYIPTNIMDNLKCSILLAEKNTLYLARYGDLDSFYEKLCELLH